MTHDGERSEAVQSAVLGVLVEHDGPYRIRDLLPALRGLAPEADDDTLRILAFGALDDLAAAGEATVAPGEGDEGDDDATAALTPAGRERHGRRLGFVLLGFDRETESLRFELQTPVDAEAARRHLRAPEHDELLDSYPLPPDEQAWWAAAAGRPLDQDRFEWFVERAWILEP